MVALFKYRTKLAFKKTGFIFLPLHPPLPHSLFKMVRSLIIILSFLMGMSSEKLMRPKFFLRKYASGFIGGASQLSEKAPYLKQLVGSCRVLSGGTSVSLLGCRGQSQKVTLPPWALAL